MCQIIALTTTKKKFKKIRNDSGIIDSLSELLWEKGGDSYGASCTWKDDSFTTYCDTFEDIIYDIKSALRNSKVQGKEPIQILLFSRQKPEMEENNVRNQPYTRQVDGDLIFAVHGTIHNDKELQQEYKGQIFADTEILQFMPIDDWHKAEGSFSVIGIDQSGVPMIYENGLKLWQNKLGCCGEHLADIISTGNLDFMNSVVIDLSEYQNETPNKILMASFSGGMDIALSTYEALSSGKYSKLILNYFAWGSTAEEAEIMSLDNFKDFYTSAFPKVKIDVNIIESEYYFDEYFKINGAPFPKISLHNTESSGEIKETESPLAYVPYRNTQFALLLASKAEAKNYLNVDFLFGLNLSEGMVFMDNSEGWLNAIEDTIQLGGKDPKVTKNYKVIAPYFARTKTNMIYEFGEKYGSAPLEQLLLLSKSCYYPDPDGSPCNECGSCILRKKALENVKKTKEDNEN